MGSKQLTENDLGFLELAEWEVAVDRSCPLRLKIQPGWYFNRRHVKTSTPRESVRDPARWVSELERVGAERNSAQGKLSALAADPVSVLGEVRITQDVATLAVCGELSAESRLGLAPGSFPRTVGAALSLVHSEDRHSFRQRLARSMKNGAPFDIQHRLSDGRGGWRWMEGRAAAVEFREGRPVHWVFTLRDFTTQKEVESSLGRSLSEAQTSRTEAQSGHDKLWKLAANAFSLLGEAQLTETGMTLEYFGEDAPEKKIGLRPGSIPRSYAELVARLHPADVIPHQEAVAHVLSTGEPLRITYRLADGYGGWRWLQARAICLEKRGGKHVRWLHDTVDITEQKGVEEALRQSLEELRQLKLRLQHENLVLREEVNRGTEQSDILGESAAVRRVLEQVALVSPTTATVLIRGETGTGKELIARAIHQRSDRRKGLFIAVNCAALPASLVESELFGHEKGAFTGAISRRLGRFEQANGGTLFLDEVGELPLETQAKMLRVLQSGEFERVGSSGRPVRVNVRVIAATNRNLEIALQEGGFRADLYHRLAVFPIHVPPLRERREDIALLAAYLVTRKGRQLGRHIQHIARDVLDRLTAYDWPGNVRELENVLERAIILSTGNTIQPHAVQLGTASRGSVPDNAHPHLAATAAGASDTMQVAERAHILRVCQSTGWKIKGPDGAAKKLDLNPGTLFARMKRLGIQRPKT